MLEPQCLTEHFTYLLKHKSAVNLIEGGFIIQNGVDASKESPSVNFLQTSLVDNWQRLTL
jgi:hypothetical protein